MAASAIANIRLVQELRDFVDQQRVLYEMSQQIATGLDLQSTLERILHWLGRLFDVEVGLLWLAEQERSQDNDFIEVLHPVAALGMELPQKQSPAVAFGQSLVGWVASSGESLIVNDPARDPRLDPDISHKLGLTLRNVMIMPMSYRGEVIGVVSLINRIGGPFVEADLTLLSTAVEMVAVAVGNARLHTQTLNLMAERERLHQHILQAERLATIGRLTASLSHEINNPMQAIQGALTLALEELDNPKELNEYLQMSLHESERVVQQINRMRQLYRPQNDKVELLNLNKLLEEVIAIARKELKRQKVTLRLNLAPKLPAIRAVANQLHIVFLSHILNLSDAINTKGGGELELRTLGLPQAVEVEFLTTELSIFDSGLTPPKENLDISSYLSHEIITAHGGVIECSQKDKFISLTIHLPIPSLHKSA
jgi:two-component system NtrC family sensor kinase